MASYFCRGHALRIAIGITAMIIVIAAYTGVVGAQVMSENAVVQIISPEDEANLNIAEKLPVKVHFDTFYKKSKVSSNNEKIHYLKPIQAVELLLNGKLYEIKMLNNPLKTGDVTFDLSFDSLPRNVNEAQLQAKIYTVYDPDMKKLVAESTVITVLFPTLITKDEDVELNILKNYNIPLENLIISTLLSEVTPVPGETTAKVIVADANKGQIVFISNPDGNPFVVAYIPASDIQNGQTTITLESIADGFIMVNPLMFGFQDSDRLAILAHAKNDPLYQDLKNEINIALQTEPNNLLEEAVFPNTYGDATLLIINALENLGGQALAQAVINAAFDVTPNTIIGETNVPHLNDLGGGNVEAINPTMIFYGFNIAELPGLSGVIAGKETLWELNLGWVWPPIDPQYTEPVKETIALGNGQYNIAFSKFGFDDAASKAASSANILKSSCIVLDVLFICPASNKAIESAVEDGFLDDETLDLIGAEFWSIKTPTALFEHTTDLLTNDKVWPWITQSLYANAADKEAAVSFLKGGKKVLKAAKVVFKVLNAHEAANVYVPFAWDLATEPTNVEYCVTEASGVLSATCQKIPPTAKIIVTTPYYERVVRGEVLLDASSSYDPIYPLDLLEVRWDFNNDGAFETDWQADKTEWWVYANEGIYNIVLQVRNQDGLIGETIHTVIINSLTAEGTANHIKAFRDVQPWDTTSFEITMSNNGYSEGIGENQYEILPSTAFATNLLTPGKDFVVIMNDQDQTFYNNLAASLPRLDRFIHNGGSIIWGASDLGWHRGSMVTAGITTLPGGVQYGQKYDINNFNVNPSTLLMSDLPDVLSGNYASHDHFMNLPDGAIIYTKDTDGFATLTEYKYGNGWTMLTGQPLEYYTQYYPDNPLTLIYPRIFNYVLGQQVAQVTQQQLGTPLVKSLNEATQNVPPSHKEN